ncbi:fungal-specific transcription factor domain-containing protein [Mycena crocata]|nr:fungal-specific transcription factor domain-containing protein [Mycena crocata]
MSANLDDQYAQKFQKGKLRRIQRACDFCRRRKCRCDGSPRNRCSTCFDADVECTFVEPPPKQQSAYVEWLEGRLEQVEAVNHQLRAQLATAFNSTNQSATPLSSDETTTEKNSSTSTSPVAEQAPVVHILRAFLRSLSVPTPPLRADDLLHLAIQRKLELLSIGGNLHHRFVGKSSGAALIDAVMNAKANVKRAERRGNGEEVGSEHEEPSQADRLASSRRPQYWMVRPWANFVPRTHAYVFPPAPLMGDLIYLYFEHVNVYLPLLHRPTFERSVATGLHLRDEGFSGTLMLVCAVASRWSTDPQVATPNLVAHPTEELGRLGCGWEWFDQVQLAGKHMFGEARLYDLQSYCLAALFLEGSSAPQACWSLVGFGLRLAQDVGAHRRNSPVEHPSVERELWKRAFWVLLYLDRALSSNMGRSCAMQYDDFDVFPPIEVDDDFWEHPTHPFQQPPGIPSRVTFFNALLRLSHILGFCLKILYSPSKVRAALQVEDTWEEKAVTELDSALNTWRDGVSEHRWC